MKRCKPLRQRKSKRSRNKKGHCTNTPYRQHLTPDPSLACADMCKWLSIYIQKAFFFLKKDQESEKETKPLVWQTTKRQWKSSSRYPTSKPFTSRRFAAVFLYSLCSLSWLRSVNWDTNTHSWLKHNTQILSATHKVSASIYRLYIAYLCICIWVGEWERECVCVCVCVCVCMKVSVSVCACTKTTWSNPHSLVHVSVYVHVCGVFVHVWMCILMCMQAGQDVCLHACAIATIVLLLWSNNKNLHNPQQTKPDHSTHPAAINLRSPELDLVGVTHVPNTLVDVVPDLQQTGAQHLQQRLVVWLSLGLVQLPQGLLHFTHLVLALPNKPSEWRHITQVGSIELVARNNLVVRNNQFSH